jgi:hypothetical protein
MRTTETIELAAPADAVFAHVAELHAYPAWLPLVHMAEPDAAHPGDHGPAWIVELRAKIGPFARSKRLRMVRAEHDPPRAVAFERAETDGREHARWALRVELAELAQAADDAELAATRLTMHLAYDGALWTGGLLERALDDQVRRGKASLAELLSELDVPPTR